MTPAELKAVRLRLGFRSRRTLAETLGVSKWTVRFLGIGETPHSTLGP